ncbi:small multi-drug export protein [Phototrophicus methaneseepsis]|uniref:Small multi-drug export protein n=1 Tax=Phototrophicus methaneseepsis TaxID=2710758 RepID=A0A7S8EDF2_9CHLR|nr:small multi-drug export protein [Phototrophicus methaneseepsis]QPC84698.1 small multi-drug export protein [Phototrophicus methaneseepsis]
MTDLLLFLAACGSIFALAFFHFWSAIPAGIALGLPPLVVMLVVIASYVTACALVLFVGGRLRTWIQNRWNITALNENSRIYRIWERWGVIGFSLLAPMTLGAQVSALLGLTLNAEPRKLFLWLTIGAIVWAVVLTIGVTLGAIGLQQAAA